MKPLDTFAQSVSKHAFVRSLMRVREPQFLRTINEGVGALSPFEKVLVGGLMGLVIISTLTLLWNINTRITTLIPRAGGSLTEGLIGSPRFINPLLAQSDTDRDLVALIYSGLMRPSGDGTLIPDLAKRYEISDDGMEYSFILRDDARFHDGTPVTADDVVFTVNMAQDSALKSPKRADWDGVTVEKISEREVRFTLSRPYAPFLENTTLGILPKHLWHDVSVQEFPFSSFNTTPVGSGPYVMDDINYNKSGIPTLYTLSAFSDFTLGEPFIQTLKIRFYPNEAELKDAWTSGAIESVGSVSTSFYQDVLDSGHDSLLNASFPRIFAVFFNQNNNHAFLDASAREALNVAIDKQALIGAVLNGHGSVIDSPIPPHMVSGVSVKDDSPTIDRTERARTILEEGGWEWSDVDANWKKDDVILTFSLKTANTPELKQVAQILADTWEKVGVPVTLNFFEAGDLNQNVIRPRDYEALLFGEVVGRSLDLFAFWHSSQKDDPGLNIAMYTNATADTLLKKARETHDKETRDTYYADFVDEIRDDVPAVFLYTPDFLYILPQNIAGVDMGLVNNPSERFANVYAWHEYTQRVWNFFIH